MCLYVSMDTSCLPHASGKNTMLTKLSELVKYIQLGNVMYSCDEIGAIIAA